MAEIRYPESQPIRLHLKRTAWSQDMLDHVEQQSGRAGEIRDLLPMFGGTRRRSSFVISEAEFGHQKVALWDRREPANPADQRMLADQQKVKPPGQPNGESKTVPVTIESVTPIAPVVQERLKPVTKPKPDVPANAGEPAKRPLSARPLLPIFRPPIQLGEDIEPIEDEDEFQ